ncbi:hypothetical protein BCR35DRAFT_331243 [Leucosporidium creatinivorum]|uniref:Uncharacterized protein n=1 Tax=Leucosporidium creatinivorum TaxID=106004 RepID=A0A1Y2FLE5_9BASI|nr:hypothetical protein BCR35DRAFT_331243 [Leucosporidium creatinivorum]
MRGWVIFLIMFISLGIIIIISVRVFRVCTHNRITPWERYHHRHLEAQRPSHPIMQPATVLPPLHSSAEQSRSVGAPPTVRNWNGELQAPPPAYCARG